MLTGIGLVVLAAWTPLALVQPLRTLPPRRDALRVEAANVRFENTAGVEVARGLSSFGADLLSINKPTTPKLGRDVLRSSSFDVVLDATAGSALITLLLARDFIDVKAELVPGPALRPWMPQPIVATPFKEATTLVVPRRPPSTGRRLADPAARSQTLSITPW